MNDSFKKSLVEDALNEESSVEDAPKKSFLLKDYNSILKKYYGYDTLKTEQFKIINTILN